MNENLPSQDIIATVIGLASALIDNVPLVAATMGMLISRYYFREFLKERYKNQYEIINNGFMSNGVYYLFALRMTPIFPRDLPVLYGPIWVSFNVQPHFSLLTAAMTSKYCCLSMIRYLWNHKAHVKKIRWERDEDAELCK